MGATNASPRRHEIGALPDPRAARGGRDGGGVPRPDARLDRDVAIKVLPERLADSAEALARFEREAKALAALSHPNLVAIFDVGTDQGICFAVMEFLAGETLLERLGRGALPLARVLEIGAAVAEGLAAAHAHGVIHRDLKPANIFLTASGQVKILDFGLARFANPEPLGATADYLTEAGRVMGTAGLHVAGAGQRRHPRRTRRHFLAGLRSLRNGDGPPGLSRRQCRRGPGRGPSRSSRRTWMRPAHDFPPS